MKRALAYVGAIIAIFTLSLSAAPATTGSAAGRNGYYRWLIEGHGVDPDIVVDNLPHATFRGRDAQLEAAVKHLQDLIAKDPVEVPKHPPYPDKKK